MRGNSVTGRLALLLCAIIWGTSFVVMKNALNSIGALWVLSIRFSISALLMFLAAGRRVKGISGRCP